MNNDIGKNMNGRRCIFNCSAVSHGENKFVFGAYYEVNGTHWINSRDGESFIIDFKTLEKTVSA